MVGVIVDLLAWAAGRASHGDDERAWWKSTFFFEHHPKWRNFMRGSSATIARYARQMIEMRQPARRMEDPP